MLPTMTVHSLILILTFIQLLILQKACNFINPIQDVPFWGCSRMGEVKRLPLTKTCHTYPTMMKLGTVIPYLKNV